MKRRNLLRSRMKWKICKNFHKSNAYLLYIIYYFISFFWKLINAVTVRCDRASFHNNKLMNLFSHKFFRKNCHLLCGIVTTQVKLRYGRDGKSLFLNVQFHGRTSSFYKDNENCDGFWLFPCRTTHLLKLFKMYNIKS